MGTSLGASLDYLANGTLKAALTAVDADVVLVDNFPATFTQSMVFIGRTNPEDGQGSNGRQMPLTVGFGTRDEDYLIPCYVSVTRPGPSQKPARDAAILLFDTVAHFVASDPTLGNALKSGRGAFIDGFHIEQTRDPADTGEAGGLRLAFIFFDIHCQNHYQP